MPEPLDASQKAEYSTRALNADRWSAILKFGGRSILDVGCGNGTYVLKLLREGGGRSDPFGCDISSYEAWKEAPERFSVSGTGKLDFPDGRFDTVLCFETLEHLRDPEAMLKECGRICRGNVIITVPNCALTQGMRRSNLTYGHWADRTHIQFFDLESITELVRRCGFRIRESGYINRIRLAPFVEEAFGLSGVLWTPLKRLLAARQREPYYLTCLVVGEKPQGG